MKKRLTVMLLSMCLLLCSCGSKNNITISLYYKSATIEPSQSSVISIESCKAAGVEDLADVAAIYLEGPNDQNLVSPFPKGTRLNSYSVRGTVLYLEMSQEFSELSGIDLSVACSCLSLTFSQLVNINSCHISSVGGELDGDDEIVVYVDDVLLENKTLVLQTESFDIYYPDSSDRYLISERKSTPEEFADDTARALYILSCLSEKPSSSALHAVFYAEPSDFGVVIDSGVCTVTLSDEFYKNVSDNYLEQRAVILSIVNSLTSLNSISSVRFYNENGQASFYGNIDITIAYSFDSTCIGPVRTGINERDASIYLLRISDGEMLEVPTRVRSEANETDAEALLTLLFSYGTLNGLTFPPSKGEIPELYENNGVCTVHLDMSEFSDNSWTQEEIESSIAETLLSLESISSVRFD